jgi:hypothetical protein
LLCAAGFAAFAAAQPSGDEALAAAVDDFLTTWLVRGDAQSAVARHVAPLNDERMVPAGWFDADAYYEKFSGEARRRAFPLQAAEFRGRFTQYLDRLAPRQGAAPAGLAQVVQPYTPAIAAADPELAEILQPREPRPLPGGRAIAYDVRGWRDISWTASGTVGLRIGLAARADGQSLQAVVTRLGAPDAPPERTALLFMLWASNAERTGQWKLWAVEPVPNE